MSTPAPSNVTLIRGLGLIAAISIVVGNVIGTGVFLKTRVMMCNVDTPWVVIGAWVAAGVLTMAGALTYAELAAMMPRAGGQYVYLREAYGAPFGFLYGWMKFFIDTAGSQAAFGAAFAIFLNILLGGTALNVTYFKFSVLGNEIAIGHAQMVAVGIILLVTLINCAAVKVSGMVATILTALKVLLVFGIGLGAFLLAGGDWGHFSMSNIGGACEKVSAAERGGLAGFGAAMVAALWAYDGWSNVTIVAEEVKNPQRNVPLALIGGMLTVLALYLFVNLAYLYVLNPTDIANVSASSSVATEVVKRFLGTNAVLIVAAAFLVSTFGALHIATLTGSRVPFVMARDRLFFQNLTKLSPRTHVPVRALLVQATWASILALSGSFDALTDLVVFAVWIFYGLSTASVFVFRQRMPDAERPYRAWGYPVVPVIFLFVTGWLLINTLWATPWRALIGLGLILLGLPFYLYWSRVNRVAYQETEGK
jgi:APA family basic amino acid/polyamine antiporter